ncbi:MAG: acetyl-CoA carboxylase biotin carboxyl carrier protein [Hydrococcus sp. Prado102]|nr:acetyl-CoA carboxylase biotin carboxyl carrier protein [Hydrococcus sp. Prado102]
MSINFNELRELLGAIAQTDITELTLKSEDFELTVRKTTPVISTPSVGSSPGTTPTAIISPSTTPSVPPAVTPVSEPPEVSAPPAPDKKWVAITSPMVGTFYRASAPDEPPFVQAGDRVSLGQTVCIIEAMKLMNEIEAEVSGQVMEIVVSNGEPVEYGQTLIWVDPSRS